MSSTLAAQQKVSNTAIDCAAVRAAVQAYTGCESFDTLAMDLVRGGPLALRTRILISLVRRKPTVVSGSLPPNAGAAESAADIFKLEIVGFLRQPLNA